MKMWSEKNPNQNQVAHPNSESCTIRSKTNQRESHFYSRPYDSSKRGRKVRKSRVRNSLSKYKKQIMDHEMSLKASSNSIVNPINYSKELNQSNQNSNKISYKDSDRDYRKYSNKISSAAFASKYNKWAKEKSGAHDRIHYSPNKDMTLLDNSMTSNNSLNTNPSIISFYKPEDGVSNLNLHQSALIDLINKVGCKESIQKFINQYYKIYLNNGRMEPQFEFNSFKSNWTYLHEASKLGNCDIASFLINEIRQDPNMISDCNSTPLSLAWTKGHVKLTKLLLKDSRTIINPIRNQEKPSKNLNDGYLECMKAIEEHKRILFEEKVPDDKLYRQRSSSFNGSDNFNQLMEELTKSRNKNFSSRRSNFETKCKNNKNIYSEEEIKSCLSRLLKTHNIDYIPYEILKEDFEYYCYTGLIWRHSSFQINHKWRWFRLNPIEWNFIEYKSKEDCPNRPYRVIPMHTVDSISILESKWFMKRSLFYWELSQFNTKYIFSCKTEKWRQEWIEKLTLLKKHADTINILKNIRYTDVKLDSVYQVTSDDKKHIEYFLNIFIKTKTSDFELVDSDKSKFAKTHGMYKISETKTQDKYEKSKCKYISWYLYLTYPFRLPNK